MDHPLAPTAAPADINGADLPDAPGDASDAPLIQLLTPAGTRVLAAEVAPYAARVARLTADDLRGMYRDMALARRFDEEATSLQRQGELGLFAPAAGQEGAQVGSGWATAAHDYLFPSYREHGVAQTRGLDLVDILRLFRGVDHGGWDAHEHRFQLYTLVVGAHPLHATGYAMGLQRDGVVGTGDPERDAAVLTYFGDGSTSQGDVNEAMVFAAVNNAPVVFFCQNNQWAISVPPATQSRVPLYRRGYGFGIPSLRIDGNDVLAAYAATSEALDRARSGGGPTFIEAFTYRMGAHTTSDDPTRYRTRAEEEYWRRRDPIDRLGALLRAEGLWDERWVGELTAECDALGERVRREVRAMTAPPAATMFDHVYATEHAIVTAEREWFVDYESATASTSPLEASR